MSKNNLNETESKIEIEAKVVELLSNDKFKVELPNKKRLLLMFLVKYVSTTYAFYLVIK